MMSDHLSPRRTSKQNDKKSRQGCYIVLQTNTWGSDSHGLYDYESKNLFRKQFRISCLQNSYLVIRNETECNVYCESEGLEYLNTHPSAKPLIRIWDENGVFFVARAKSKAERVETSEQCGLQAEEMGIVVRTVKERSIKIAEGDIIKLGRYRLKIKEVVGTAAQAQTAASRRLFSADTDECETVAPEPELNGEGPRALDAKPDELPEEKKTEGNEQDKEPDEGHEKEAAEEPEKKGEESEDVIIKSVDDNNNNCPQNVENPDEGVEEKSLSEQQDDSSKNDGEIPTTPSRLTTILMRSASSSQRACRICLCDVEEPGNPLIAPCRCKGSMRLIHLGCLRTWMEGRLNIRNDGQSISFYWRTLDCELCKAPYPTFVEGENNKPVELFEIPRPEYPYIILEPKSHEGRGLYVVSLVNKKVAKLGRGHDSDIRLSDISVSRFHATLRFTRGFFIVEDQRSKFGTLLELRKPLRLDPNTSDFSLQLGRSMVRVALKKPLSMLPACLKSSPCNDTDISVTNYPLPARVGGSRPEAGRQSGGIVEVTEEANSRAAPMADQDCNQNIEDADNNDDRQVAVDEQ